MSASQVPHPVVWRAAVRSLRDRLPQTLLVVVAVALVAAAVVFAAGYERQVEQTVVDAALASGEGNTWLLTGPAGADLAALVPAGSQRVTGAPVAGRAVPLAWGSPRVDGPIDATLSWRADVCAHLVLVAGRCPARPGEVAVSTADAAAYRVGPGDRLPQRAGITESTTFDVTGVYRVADPGDPYWFDRLPVGRSGTVRVDTTDLQGDALITVRDSFRGPYHGESLDVRIEHDRVRVADVDDLAGWTSQLDRAALEHQSRLVSAVPTSLDRIAAERARTRVGLLITLVQLGSLMVVVLVLLAGATASSQRAEAGLARLRGERPRAVLRLIMGRWAVVVVLGWAMGCVAGVALLALTAWRLPGQHGLPVDAVVVVAPPAALAVMVVIGFPAARGVVEQPVVSLLRPAPALSSVQRGRELLVDVVLLVLAVAGLAVATQSGTAGAVGLAVPSLLAVATGILLARVLARLAAAGSAAARAGRLRPHRLVRSVVGGRLPGWRVVTVVVCLATAFAVFAVQVEAVGGSVRARVAQARVGAPAIIGVTAPAPEVVAALDELDPRHRTAAATLTAVTTTSRADAGATRGMFVEPAAFRAIAYGVDRVAPDQAWAQLDAPAVEPVTLVGDRITARIGAHPSLARTSGTTPARVGTRAVLGLDYLDDAGVARSTALGQVELRAAPAQQLRQQLPCSAGCRLLRITLDPDGPLQGTLPLTSLGTEGAGASTIDLGGEWQPTSTSPGADMLARPDGAGLALDVTSGGETLAVQQAWLPLTLPVVVGAGVREETDPTLAGPDGRAQPVRPVGRASDALPRELDGAAVGNLDTVLRAGVQPGPASTTTQVWVAPAAVGRLGEIEQALRDRGLGIVDVSTAAAALSAQRSSAAALTSTAAVWFAALAAVFMVLGLVLVLTGQRRVLEPDVQALVRAGVPRTALRGPVVTACLARGLLAAVLGVAAGAVGFVLVAAGLPLVPDVPAVIRLDRTLRIGPLVASAGAALVLVAATILTGLRWLRPRRRGAGPRREGSS